MALGWGGGGSYVFSKGSGAVIASSGNQAIVTTGGTYSVIVTTNGCSSTTSIQIDQNTTGQVTIGARDLFTLRVTGMNTCVRTVQGVLGS